MCVVSCSDRRISDPFDTVCIDLGIRHGKKVIKVRTGGADAINISHTLLDLSTKGVDLFVAVTHTHSKDISQGCGWAGRLKVELDASTSGNQLDTRCIGDAQIAQFMSKGFTTREQIESNNASVQTELLKWILQGTGAQVLPGITLDNATIKSTDNPPYALAIITPSASPYSEIEERLNSSGKSLTVIGRDTAYFSQVGRLEEALTDAKLFVTLGITEIRMMLQGDQIGSWENGLRSERSLADARLIVVPETKGRQRGRRLKA